MSSVAPKEILHGDAARQALKRGMKKLANAVKVTLGPCGRLVIYQTPYTPCPTKDGISVAKNVALKDPFENMGADLIRQAAQKTVEEAGDGTTTATVLAMAMIEGGMKLLKKNQNVQAIRRGMEKAVIKAEEIIKASAIIVGLNDVEGIAAVSANDPVIGKLVFDAIKAVGIDGVVTVEQSNGLVTTVEVAEGMQIERGYVSPYMAGPDGKVDLKDVPVAITDRKLTEARQILAFMETAQKAGHSKMLLICEELEGTALTMAVVNRMKGAFNCVVVTPPWHGDNKKAILEDIAVLTGATVLTEEIGVKGCPPEALGHIARLTGTKDKTVLVGGSGEPKKILERVALICEEIKNAEPGYTRDNLEERRAKLGAGIAVIKVGGATENEMLERKDRVDDAVLATKAALLEGIVGGAGRIYREILEQSESNGLEKGECCGYNIVMDSLQEPERIIARNACLSFQELREGSQEIMDPAKVARCAIKNAVSVAIMVLTSDCVMAEA